MHSWSLNFGQKLILITVLKEYTEYDLHVRLLVIIWSLAHIALRGLAKKRGLRAAWA